MKPNTRHRELVKEWLKTNEKINKKLRESILSNISQAEFIELFKEEVYKHYPTPEFESAKLRHYIFGLAMTLIKDAMNNLKDERVEAKKSLEVTLEILLSFVAGRWADLKMEIEDAKKN